MHKYSCKTSTPKTNVGTHTLTRVLNIAGTDDDINSNDQFLFSYHQSGFVQL